MFFTSLEINLPLQESNPQISQATVYRNLALLQSLGLIRPVHFPGKPLCYENAMEKEHHHFLCNQCKKIVHLDRHLLTGMVNQLQTQYQIHDLTLGLLVTGYCETCWQTVHCEKEVLVEKTEVEKEQ